MPSWIAKKIIPDPYSDINHFGSSVVAWQTCSAAACSAIARKALVGISGVYSLRPSGLIASKSAGILAIIIKCPCPWRRPRLIHWHQAWPILMVMLHYNCHYLSQFLSWVRNKLDMNNTISYLCDYPLWLIAHIISRILREHCDKGSYTGSVTHILSH